MARIPVKDLAALAEKHNGRIAVLVLYDQQDNNTHVVSWGDNPHMCDRAAQLSEHLKKAMGWPEKQWSTIPSRVAKLHHMIGDVVREVEDEGIELTRPSFIAKWGKFKKDLIERAKKVMEPANES